jgi:hypothetical protein
LGGSCTLTRWAKGEILARIDFGDLGNRRELGRENERAMLEKLSRYRQLLLRLS